MKNQLIQKILIHLAVKLLNLWFSTCKVQIIGEKWHEKYILGKDKIIGATWHRGAIFLVWFFRNAHPMIMFSQSKDGDLLAGFAEKLGIRPIRGSSSKGGRKALKDMNAYMGQPGDRKAATVLDGPRGPKCVAKKGMIILSMMAGVPVMPIMVSATSAITFRKSWDKTIIPLPFSKITVIYSKPVFIPRRVNATELETYRLNIETTLNTMMREADEITGHAPLKEENEI